MAAATELAAVVDGLATAAVSTVFVDVADITFADSTLPNFCVLLRALLPTGAALAVCRPAPMTRWILEETGMGQILTLRDNLPLLDVSRTTPPSRENQWHGRPDRQEGPGSSAS